MSFDLYLECFGEARTRGLPSAATRSLFPVIDAESQPNLWRVRYDAANSCLISLSPSESRPDNWTFLSVERLCGDLRLWEALFSILQMGPVLAYWPGGSPVVASQHLAASVSDPFIEGLGPAVTVTSASEFLRAVQNS